jgi:uncharacterized protein YlxP (DUF503 family)
MFVGVQRLVLQIPGARSLKDRRQVVRSFKERVQARLRISVAEVGDLERASYAVVAMAVVSNDAAVCDEVLAKAATMASTLANAVLADRATEVVPYGHGGSGIRGGIEQLRLSEDSDWSEDEEEEDAR